MFTKEEQDRVGLVLNLINNKNYFEAEEELKRLSIIIPDNFFLCNIYLYSAYIYYLMKI